MELQFYGANCIVINTKGARVVVDDNLADIGLKSVTKPEDIALFTDVPAKTPNARLVFSDPGEYEASEISIFGIPARGHMDEADQQNATVYKIQYGDLRVAVAGHIHPDIHEDHLEELGAIDILFIPVGGNGYTLDGIGALSVVKKFGPKLVIPTHYDDKGIKYEVPQQPLTEALKGLAMEPKDTITGKYKPKPADFGENTQLIVLERS